MKRVSQFLFVITVLSAAVVAAPITYNYQEDPMDKLFGHLNQKDVNGCKEDPTGTVACGPTAAVNSFVFLQNKYPGVYDNKLVPHLDDNTQYQDMVAAANKLAEPGYMDCAICNGGTTRADFFNGKKKYIEERVPGMTIYMDAGSQAPRSVGKVPPAFLVKELKDMEDVEAVVTYLDEDGNRIAGHFLTLTGINWTDGFGGMADGQMQVEEEALIYFVDPGTGAKGVASTFQFAADGPIYSDYAAGSTVDGVKVKETRMDYVVSESPVPEPGTLVLFVSGAYGIWLRRRRGGSLI
jgi:hypothetical protein